MQWSQEHVQWPEQYLDVSSTTPSPAHKTDANRLARQRHQYPWAHDDISALTASNLLKKYAEKYSGLGVAGGGGGGGVGASGGDGASYERPDLNPYGEGLFGAPPAVNGQKLEGDAWQMSLSAEGSYSVNSLHLHHHHHHHHQQQQQQQQQQHLDDQDLKPTPGPSLAPGEGLGGHGHGGLVGASPSNVTDPRYAPQNPNANPCGPPPPSAVPAGVGVSADYSSGYNGSYMSSGYCGQPGTPLAPPHPSPLHSSGLLQPVHPTPTLVPGFNPGPMYSYPTNSYPTQPGMGPGYSGSHSVASYLPSSIAAPTPLPPSSSLPGYPYQSHALVSASASGSLLKRKVFEMSSELEEEEGGGGRYKRYGYAQPGAPSAAYQMPEDGGPDGGEFGRGGGVVAGGGGGGGGGGGEAIQGDFKPSKRILAEVGKYRGQEKKGIVVPPSYSSGRVKFPSALLNGERPPPAGETTLGRQFGMSNVEMASASASQLEEQLKSLEPGLLELVSSQIVDCGPPVQWGDVAGLGGVKAVIEEQVLWPLTRPGAYGGVNGPPKSFLFFGPRGGSKTVLTRCVAAQLGATYLKINASSFVSKWKGEAEQILRATFLVARSRQPSVLFVNELEAILSPAPASASAAASPGAGDEGPGAAGHLGSIGDKFLSQVEGLVNSNSDQVVLIGGTRRPDNLEEGTHRYFAKRLYISPPDPLARGQVLSYSLSQQEHSLSEAEIDSIVQHTDGYSGNDLLQLCREAVSCSLAQASGLTSQPPTLGYKDFEVAFCKVRPSVSQKELELNLRWSKLFGSSNRE